MTCSVMYTFEALPVLLSLLSWFLYFESFLALTILHCLLTHTSLYQLDFEATMARNFVCVAVMAISLASAMPWEGPKPTQTVVLELQHLGWSPKPTAEPAQLFGVYELRKRQSSAALTLTAAASSSGFVHATCGFLEGAAGNILPPHREY